MDGTNEDRTDEDGGESLIAEFLANDRAMRKLGITLEDSGPGRARLAMTVTGDMLNGFGMAHGGLIYALADSAFGLACNSHGIPAVAEFCSITYAAPARAGDRLTATCEERLRRKRAALYHVTVTNQNDDTVAVFDGHARTVGQATFPPSQ